MLVFEERGKPEYPEKNLSEQGREPTTNSTDIWRRRRDLNPGHIGGRRVLSPLRHPCSSKGERLCHYSCPTPRQWGDKGGLCFSSAHNLKSLEPTTRLCPPLITPSYSIVLFACVRYLVVLPFHAYLKRGINHFLLSLQLSMPILCVVWLFCFSYKPYFSQVKQLACGMWESRDYIPAGHHQ